MLGQGADISKLMGQLGKKAPQAKTHNIEAGIVKILGRTYTGFSEPQKSAIKACCKQLEKTKTGNRKPADKGTINALKAITSSMGPNQAQDK